MTLRLRMAAELIEHRALGVEHAPVRIVGRMRPAENLERLIEIASFGQSAAIGAEQRHVGGVADRGLFEHGDRLGALVGGAQAARIDHGGVGIVRIGAVARARGFERLPPFGVAARRRVGADRAGGVVARGLAASDRQRQ